STVLRTIERLTPHPVDEALARARSGLLEVSALPTIDGLIDDADLALAPDLENVDIDDPVIAAAAESVARISGLAASCGTVPSGSGFVVAEDMVMTNAHVVAGVSTPMVELPGEPARDGQVVYFDPVDDLAVIAADVQAPPLPLTDAAAGDSAVVHGYPYGGPPSTVPAGVAATGSFRVPDIYGQSPTDRSVATLQSEIESGNSGGPVLSPEGEVMGVVFARDEARQDIGYALASNEVTPVLEALDSAQDPVATGPCAAWPAPRAPARRGSGRAGAPASCPELCVVVGMGPFIRHIAGGGAVRRGLGPGEASSGSVGAKQWPGCPGSAKLWVWLPLTTTSQSSG